MALILQSALPFIPWLDPRTARLPGVVPMEKGDWLRVDDAYAGQMAERDRLIATNVAAVHALSEPARAAAEELYDRVLADLRAVEGFVFAPGQVTRPDGVVVALDRSQPLLTLGRLVQEDFCLMQQVGAEHVLTGAILCFPASWTLAEKFGRPLTGIHAPVKPYGEDLARRVQRMFDMIRPEQSLWRMNFLTYADPELHQPRAEDDRRPRSGQRDYMRVERQCFVRLPVTQAVVFSIHSYVVRVADLSEEARAGITEAGL